MDTSLIRIHFGNRKLHKTREKSRETNASYMHAAIKTGDDDKQDVPIVRRD